MASVKAKQQPTLDATKQSISDVKVGSVPLPVYLCLSALILAAGLLQQLPVNMLGGFAVILTIGWLLGTIGASIPGLKNFGGPAILSLLVPSILVFFNLINPNVLEATNVLMKQANFLYFYIACLVSGSILGMNRKMLIQGLFRMIIPMLLGMICAMAVGTLVGVLLGLDWQHTLFYIVTPVLAGGIKVSDKEDLSDILEDKSGPLDVKMMGAGVLTACTLFISGHLMQHLTGFPGPVLMIVIAALMKYVNVIPQETQNGAKQLYKFISGNFTFPLMAGLGLLYIPLKDVVATLSLPYFIVVISVVFTVVSVGFFVSRFLNMHPVEAAIISSCQSGMGGTGDVAILSTANRMNLMPFAQVATRLGGAITVIIMTAILRMIFK
ncbi:Malate Na(+) symporter [Streptococcus pneumoniae]|nr:Malate Na(+) symporter [Streptococcus pneumoniae]